jgi:hypothetical protein
MAISSAISPGASPGVALRKVERRKPERSHSIRACVKEPRLADGVLRSAALEITRPALVADRRNLPVWLCADADALDGRGSMGGVVEDERPRERHFHRPPDRAGPKRRQHGVRAQKQFAAEAASEEGRHEAHLLFRQAQCGREIGSPSVDQLVRRPDREPVAVPYGCRGMRLHHRVRVIRCGVGLVEPHRSVREGRLEVAGRALRLARFGRHR